MDISLPRTHPGQHLGHQGMQAGFYGGAMGMQAFPMVEMGASPRDMLRQLRRHEQHQHVVAKAQVETEFFWEEQRRALAAKSASNEDDEGDEGEEGQGKDNAREAELFARQPQAGLNFSKYDSIAVERSGVGHDEVAPLQTFASLSDTLPAFLSHNLGLCKYDQPTPVQKHAIPLAMAGNDLMCCAQTGSGKTCAFLLPAVATLHAKPREVGEGPAQPRVVVVAPTRELASQIHTEALKLTYRTPIRAVEVYGGVEARPQLSQLAVGADIVVATPGRLLDFVDRGVVSLSAVSFLVIDEADRMLDMGFAPQISALVHERDMPPKTDRQTLMFSATFPEPIQTLAKHFLRDYVWVGVGRVGSTTENITQRLVLCEDPDDKPGMVLDVLAQVEGRAIVFVEKKKTAAWLCHFLNRNNVRATAIHGNRSQSERETALSQFKSGAVPVLVATDVAARGLDVPDCKHVVNYDLPNNIDDYVHRIGRTGRAGHTGIATALYVPGHSRLGNGVIAQQLLQLLKEAKCEVPEWFEALPDMQGNPNRNAALRGASGNNNNNGGGGWHHAGFGARDVRGWMPATQYSVSMTPLPQPTPQMFPVAHAPVMGPYPHAMAPVPQWPGSGVPQGRRKASGQSHRSSISSLASSEAISDSDNGSGTVGDGNGNRQGDDDSEHGAKLGDQPQQQALKQGIMPHPMAHAVPPQPLHHQQQQAQGGWAMPGEHAQAHQYQQRFPMPSSPHAPAHQPPFPHPHYAHVQFPQGAGQGLLPAPPMMAPYPYAWGAYGDAGGAPCVPFQYGGGGYVHGDVVLVPVVSQPMPFTAPPQRW